MSGYTNCACRDCMDTTVSSDTSKAELCSECKDAGCVAIATYNESVQFCTTYECQRDDAYGADSESASVGDNTALNAVEGPRKSLADPTLTVGDVVFCHGVYATVGEIVFHAPWMHNSSPIRNDWMAEEIITDEGSRWHGHAPDGPAGDVTV